MYGNQILTLACAFLSIAYGGSECAYYLRFLFTRMQKEAVVDFSATWFSPPPRDGFNLHRMLFWISVGDLNLRILPPSDG
ncbi:hypothetical protein KCP75_10185 [Salmonella enterica subsp. enterica]|nr:hypothetical protein KCP75_10185 [Salmonella enterica subsp. enterica]